MSILETQYLSRTVNSDRIIDDLSVVIPESKVLVVVGPSGAGKSSFLRLLNRLDEPTGGTVLFNGEDYRSIPPQTLRKRVGLVPHGLRTSPTKMSTMPRSRGTKSSQADRFADHCHASSGRITTSIRTRSRRTNDRPGS